MNTHPMKRQLVLTGVSSILLCAFARFAVAADSTKPTPRPGTLGAYASGITLDRTVLPSTNGRLVLTNDNIGAPGSSPAITLGTVEPYQNSGQKALNDEDRWRWRTAHKKQSRVIVELERRRELLEAEIDLIERQRQTVRTLARLQQMEVRLQLLDREIAVERAQLTRIVREARQHGAEPGWFR